MQHGKKNTCMLGYDYICLRGLTGHFGHHPVTPVPNIAVHKELPHSFVSFEREVWTENVTSSTLHSFPVTFSHLLMTMNIRPFHRADTEQVVALWHRSGLLSATNDPYRDIERKLLVDAELFLIGEQDGRVVASIMAGYEGHRGWLNYLAVDPERRRQGLGRLIVAAAEDLLRTKGAPKINLQIRTSNLEVIAFYRSLGYLQDEVISMGKRLVQDNPGVKHHG